MFDDLDLIFGYSRADALSDGSLVDVTETAKGVGFRFPVALTSAVYDGCVTVPHGVTAQDEQGRLWDILWMLRLSIRRTNWEEPSILFSVRIQNNKSEPRLVELKAVCGPGDDFEPCITVMFPTED